MALNDLGTLLNYVICVDMRHRITRIVIDIDKSNKYY